MNTSNDMDDIYENIAEYNPNKERNRLIIFDNMADDMLSNKKLQQLVTKLFIRWRKLNISLVLYGKPFSSHPHTTIFCNLSL